MGGYQYLIEQNGDFAEFLRTYLTDMDEEASDEGMHEGCTNVVNV